MWAVHDCFWRWYLNFGERRSQDRLTLIFRHLLKFNGEYAFEDIFRLLRSLGILPLKIVENSYEWRCSGDQAQDVRTKS